MKSSRCASSGCVEVEFVRTGKCDTSSCVEVSKCEHGVKLRNSDNPDVVLHYTWSEWDAFVEGVKLGEFDLPPAV